MFPSKKPLQDAANNESHYRSLSSNHCALRPKAARERPSNLRTDRAGVARRNASEILPKDEGSLATISWGLEQAPETNLRPYQFCFSRNLTLSSSAGILQLSSLESTPFSMARIEPKRRPAFSQIYLVLESLPIGQGSLVREEPYKSGQLREKASSPWDEALRQAKGLDVWPPRLPRMTRHAG